MNYFNFSQLRWILGVVCAISLVACKPRKTELKSPPHYNFEDVQTTHVELRIKEISGLAWDGQRNIFWAHNDESGTLFMLDRDTKKIINEAPFGGKGDYEDVAVVQSTPYVLRSDGMITRVTRDSATNEWKGEQMGKIALEGSVDFETMYFDSSRHALVLICKNCKSDDKGTVSAYAYYLDSTGFDTKPIFRIDAAKVEQMSPKETSKLQPSAARINPRLKKLFIISSAANLLVVADLNGNVESVHWLKPKLFPQPEGLTFNKTGDMYISNEGVTGEGTIHRFGYRE